MCTSVSQSSFEDEASRGRCFQMLALNLVLFPGKVLCNRLKFSLSSFTVTDFFVSQTYDWPRNFVPKDLQVPGHF